MLHATSTENGNNSCWVMVRRTTSGQFTAEAAGLPRISVTAPSREEALDRVHQILEDMVASGELVVLDVPPSTALNSSTRRSDPNDPNEQAYLEALARDRQDDLDNTLRELGQKCSSSPSTPTT